MFILSMLYLQVSSLKVEVFLDTIVCMHFFPPVLPLLPLESKMDTLHQNSFPVGILYTNAHIGPSLLVFETLHSNGSIFPFLLCFLLLFFSQLFVRPPQTAILLFCISFPWGWSCALSPVQCHEPPSIVYQALCLSDLVL